MTQLFDSYTEDINKSFHTLNSEISNLKKSPLSKKESCLPSLKVELYEIQKLIKLMETQIVSFSGKTKNISAQKIKSFKMDYETMRKKVICLDQEIRNQRNKEKDSSTPNTTSHSLQLNQKKSSKSKNSKYSKLQETRSDDEDTNFKLKESVKIMHEISDMSDKISYDLSTQTAQLENSTSKLGRIRGQLIKGEKKIKKIMIRIKKNQLVLYLVIMMILLMAAFLVFKLFG